jgi:hypothetical protein
MRTRCLYGSPNALVPLLFYFSLVHFYNTHQVLVRLPQGVGGLAILFYYMIYSFVLVNVYKTHQMLVGHPQGLVALLFYLIFTYSVLVYFYNTHQVLVGLP